MKFKKIIKLLLSLIKHPVYTTRIIFNDKKHSLESIDDQIVTSSDWLIKSQNANTVDSGYARKYSLVSGWDHSYIETTGYIIPTLHEVSKLLDIKGYEKSSIAALYWLIDTQSDDGSFAEIDNGSPQVFDTGQVLIGLNYMFKNLKDNKIIDSINKAASWLVQSQEQNGSWVKNSYNNRPHAYYSRVAAALLEAGQICENQEYIEASIRNLNWTLDQRNLNGYFNYSEFKPGEDAILHTIVYVLEGFSMAYDLTKDQKWLDILTEGADCLMSHLNHDGLMYSQYNPEWKATNKEYCVTGLAQMAGIFFDVAKINNDMKFFRAGEKIINHLSGWQIRFGKNTIGARPSSIPIWGYYGGMDFYNWNNKFYIDALLKYRMLKSI